MNRAQAWRDVETRWLLLGEVAQAARCRAVVEYWDRPWWRRVLTSRYAVRLLEQVSAGSAAILQRHVEAVWR